jgi:Ca2+-transporting ATPase
LDLLNTSPRGLTTREALRRLQESGVNELTHAHKATWWGLFIDQFKDFMILVLLAATLISALMGEIVDAMMIVIIVMLNAVLGVVQEFRAERALEALRQLNSPAARIIRDGRDATVPASELVPGDIALIESGDRASADMRVLEAFSLEVDESILTGESLPVVKGTEAVASATPLSERKPMVYSGTVVTRGRATAIVVSTGMETELGRIAHLIAEEDSGETPLQRRLAQLGNAIVIGCLLVCLAVVLLGLYHGRAWHEMFLAGVSLAVAAIPEGLPAIVTIVLAMGVQRMSRENAVVRRLPAVETLGCATVICSDKTGTMTRNEMTVREIWIPGRVIRVSGEGYDVRGDFAAAERRVNASQDDDILRLLRVGALCNTATFGKRGELRGDPTELALLVAAAKARIDLDSLRQQFAETGEYPFDSERKRMSTLHQTKSKALMVCAKGAPEVMLARCRYVRRGARVQPLDEAARAEVQTAVDGMTARALRVLLIAYREFDSSPASKDEWEQNLVLAGLVGLLDPPRPEVLHAIETCKMAGIKVIMITGDHARTAAAIARDLRLISDNSEVLTGQDLAKMSAAELKRKVQTCRVFARVDPRQKLDIVKALKANHEVVAMTGDGINDAPALKSADIGVAMGKQGTDVAREASGLVLTDDNFATIVAAVGQGRGIYDNIRKFIRYLLACNLGELITVFVSMALGMPLPLRPMQLLWINLVTDGLPAMALGVDSADRTVMQRPPRDPAEGVFSRGLGRKIVTRGVLIGLSTAGIYAYTLYALKDLSLARTMAFVTLIAAQLIHVYDCRSETMGILEKGITTNPLLNIGVLTSALMTGAVLYVPYLSRLFETVPLDAAALVFSVSLGGIGTLIIGFRRAFRRRMRPRRAKAVRG